MYTGIKHLHSYLAYVLLALLVIAIIHTIISYARNNPFTERNRKIALMGLIASHLQLVFGLILYFISPMGIEMLSAEAMKSTILRLYTLEHPLMMIIAILLITIGYSKAVKASTDHAKHSRILIYYLIGLLLILLRIPWQAWP